MKYDKCAACSMHSLGARVGCSGPELPFCMVTVFIEPEQRQNRLSVFAACLSSALIDVGLPGLAKARTSSEFKERSQISTGVAALAWMVAGRKCFVCVHVAVTVLSDQMHCAVWYSLGALPGLWGVPVCIALSSCRGLPEDAACCFETPIDRSIAVLPCSALRLEKQVPKKSGTEVWGSDEHVQESETVGLRGGSATAVPLQIFKDVLTLLLTPRFN